MPAKRSSFPTPTSPAEWKRLRRCRHRIGTAYRAGPSADPGAVADAWTSIERRAAVACTNACCAADVDPGQRLPRRFARSRPQLVVVHGDAESRCNSWPARHAVEGCAFGLPASRAVGAHETPRTTHRCRLSNDGWHAADLHVRRRPAQARASRCGAIRTATAAAARSHARRGGAMSPVPKAAARLAAPAEIHERAHARQFTTGAPASLR